MSEMRWTTEPGTAIKSHYNNFRLDEVTSLVRYAVDSVNILCYLDDLDSVRQTTSRRDSTHNLVIVDLAHASWATVTAITALDRCAAALGRQYFPNLFNSRHIHELDIRQLKSKINNSTNIPLEARNWVYSVDGDQRYGDIKDFRNPLTHSLVYQDRNLLANIGPRPSRPAPRQGFRLLSGKAMDARELVIVSKELAAQYVDKFLNIFANLT